MKPEPIRLPASTHAGVTPAVAPYAAEVEPWEYELAQLQTEFLNFGGADPVRRSILRHDWTRQLAGYLEAGFLEDDSGPVRRVVESARCESGVEPGLTNLTLQDDVRVLGFLDNQGVGDTFYACRNLVSAVEYFAITIVSGAGTAGPYDVHVSEAMDWSGFREQLPGM